MDEKEAYAVVRKALKTGRFEHTERVVAEAVRLADRYGGRKDHVKLAAILHDYAKYRPADEMRETVRNTPRLPDRLLDYSAELLHAFAGAEYIKNELGVEDEAVLSAVRYHTTGRAGMSIEEKIVFLADYIEPGRTFKEAEEVRELAGISLDSACLACLKHTIRFLTGKLVPVYPDTFEAYNDLALSLTDMEGKEQYGTKRKA